MIALATSRAAASRLLRAIEPFYDWGKINVVNLDAQSFDDQFEGDVRFFELQWLGIHLSFQFGRTPRSDGGR